MRAPERGTWHGMRDRCNNPQSKYFAAYGGRGIRVCARWSRFAAFLEDMGARPPGRSLDRINNDGDYEPGNCRWATPKQQARNRRNSRFVTVNGEAMTVVAAAEIFGINRATLYDRLDAGWPVDSAVTRSPNRARLVPLPAVTHCIKGHAYDERNTYYLCRGGRTTRTCRACNAEAQKRRAVRLSEARA